MNTKDRMDPLKDLDRWRRLAPEGFTRRVLARLPERPGRRAAWWPSGWGWLLPAAAGAAATLLAVALLPFGGRLPPPVPSDRMVVHFEIHAPAAGRVELVGDFTHWQPGQLHLEGPDETGHWTARVELPAGRYEYLFLVDGQRWVTDPTARVHRPDGFGNLNAVMNL